MSGIKKAPYSVPTPSPSSMTFQQLTAKAVECDLLRRDIDVLQRQLHLSQAEVMHWRNLAREHNLISEKDYECLSAFRY